MEVEDGQDALIDKSNMSAEPDLFWWLCTYSSL